MVKVFESSTEEPHKVARHLQILANRKVYEPVLKANILAIMKLHVSEFDLDDYDDNDGTNYLTLHNDSAGNHEV